MLNITFKVRFLILTQTVKSYLSNLKSVDTKMCCPKGRCGCQYFILLTLKKKIMDTGVLDFFNKKLIPGLLFLLKVLSCVFISDFHQYSRIKQMNKYNIDFFYMHLFTMRSQCVLNRSFNQDAHYSCLT